MALHLWEQCKQMPVPIWRRINDFWEFQHNDRSAQMNEQPNGFMYLNTCFHILNWNIVCNMSALYSVVEITKNDITTTLIVSEGQQHSLWAMSLAELSRGVLQRDLPGVVKDGIEYWRNQQQWLQAHDDAPYPYHIMLMACKPFLNIHMKFMLT